MSNIATVLNFMIKVLIKITVKPKSRGQTLKEITSVDYP